jgi:hypothetical protein
MRSCLIDPTRRIIAEINHDDDSLETLHRLVDADMTTSFVWQQHRVYVDDVGHVRKKDAFRLDGFKYPLAGNALIMGPKLTKRILISGYLFVDDPGNRFAGIANCTLTLNEIESAVHWLGQDLECPTLRQVR